MAQFPAEILLTVNNKGVLNKINEIERALKKFEQKSKALIIQDEASARFYRQKLDYLKQQNAQLKIAEDRTKRIAQQTAATTKSLQKRVSAAAGGGLIGAGFPALFGASKGEVVGGGIGGIFGGLAGGQTGAFTGSIIGSAIGKITQARAEVKQLAEELGFSATQAKVLEEAFKSAGLKGAESFEKTVTKVSGSGLELKDQVSVIKAATELSRVYRGEVSKIAGAFTDVLLKGKVAVSDLNKLQSQGIPIQDALAKKLGVSRTELLQLTKDGKISVQTLANEFINLGNNAKDAPAKAKGEFDKLTDALLDAAAGVGTLATNLLRILKPAIEQLTKDVTGLINKINELVRIGPVGDLQREITGGKLRDLTSFGATPETVLNLENALKNVTAEGLKSKDAIDAVELAVARAAARSQEFKGKAGELAEKTVQPQITRLQKEIADARQVLGLVETANKDLPNITVPADLDTSGSSSGGGAAPQNDTKRAEELLRTLNQQLLLQKEAEGLDRDRLRIFFEMEDTLKDIQDLQGVSPELLGQLSQAAGDLAKIKDDAAVLDYVFNQTAAATKAAQDALRPLDQQRRLLEAKLNGTEREARLQIEIENATRGLTPELAKQVELRIRGNAALQDQVDQLANLQQLAGSISDSLEDGIVAGLSAAVDALVTGADDLDKKLKQIAQGVLADIGQQLIKFGISTLFKSIGGGGPGGIFDGLFRAEGGPVAGGQPYIVGEKGPELFIPGVTGTVSNNDQFEAAREAMSGGTGGGVSETGGLGSEGVSSAFADNTSSISTTNSYMRERSMETNNQTTIGGAGSMTIETQVINNVEYATVEQVRLASAASAKQAKAQVFSDMKNKPAVRRKAGIN